MILIIKYQKVLIVFSLHTTCTQSHLASELQDFPTKPSIFSPLLQIYFLINLHYKPISMYQADNTQCLFGNRETNLGILVIGPQMIRERFQAPSLTVG